MTDIASPEAVAAQAASTAERGENRYLFNPVIDFFTLGGGSLLVLFPLVFLPPDSVKPTIAFAVWLMAHTVNHPHFIHSYQLFYADFGRKIRGDGYSANLQKRYIFAGLGVPALFALFFAWSLATKDAQLLAKGINLMLLTVGWHYVKQGYGILMVESVLKKSFFDTPEKTVLRWNGLAVWLFSWVYANKEAHESNYWGLQYISLDLPDWTMWLALAVMITMSGAAVFVALRKLLGTGRLPWNGLLAYAASAYVWLVAIHFEPIFLALVPAFHSMQYNAVVWRYQLNKEGAEPGAWERGLNLGVVMIPRPVLMLMRFVFVGTVFGVFAFWIIPAVMSYGIPYDREVFGVALFMFMSWIFINVHHYFMDNVMWRRENPEIKKHLFTAR